MLYTAVTRVAHCIFSGIEVLTEQTYSILNFCSKILIHISRSNNRHTQLLFAISIERGIHDRQVLKYQPSHSVFFFDFCFTDKYQKYTSPDWVLKSVISVFCTFLSINQKVLALQNHSIPFLKALVIPFSKKSCMFL